MVAVGRHRGARAAAAAREPADLARALAGPAGPRVRARRLARRPAWRSGWRRRSARRARTSPRACATTRRRRPAALVAGPRADRRRSWRCRWSCWWPPGCSCARSTHGQQVDPGFDIDERRHRDVRIGIVGLRRGARPRVLPSAARARRRTRHVAAVSYAGRLPLMAGSSFDNVTIDGARDVRSTTRRSTPATSRWCGIPLVQGRAFARDRRSGRAERRGRQRDAGAPHRPDGSADRPHLPLPRTPSPPSSAWRATRSTPPCSRRRRRSPTSRSRRSGIRPRR